MGNLRFPESDLALFSRITRKSLRPSNIRDIREFDRLTALEKLHVASAVSVQDIPINREVEACLSKLRKTAIDTAGVTAIS